MKDFSYAIFDMDGTLINSMPYWHNLGKNYLISKGITPQSDLNQVIKDMTLKESAEYFQSYYHVNETVTNIMKQVNQMIAKYYECDIQLKNGVKEYLQYLKDRHVKMCIATTSSKELAELVCKRLKIFEFFTDIISSDQIGSGKDKPDIYEFCLKQLNAKKENTVVYEDAKYAIHTLVENHFNCIAVYDESQKKITEELKFKCVDYIQSFEEYVL